MTELIPSLPSQPSYVLITLARQSARWAVKDELRSRGVRPQYMRAKEINAAADLYFVAHSRELLTEAWRKVQSCPDLMRFYQKELRDRQRRTVHILICDHLPGEQRGFSMTTHPTEPRDSVVMRPVRKANAEYRVREHLTEAEVEKLLTALKGNRHGQRDWLIGLLIYRHGLRVSEACDLRWDDIDLAARTVVIRRLKGSRDSTHYLERDELAGLRRLPRSSAYVFINERGDPFKREGIARMIQRAGAGLPFPVHVHMLRHACGYALANKGMDTRRLQHYLGHASITNTVRYSAMSPDSPTLLPACCGSSAVGDDDHVRLGQHLQARCQIRRLTDGAALLRFSRANRVADHDQPSRNPDTGLQQCARLKHGDGGDQLQSRPDRPLRVVLLSLRVAEVYQDTVAHVVRHEATEALHGLCDALLVGRDNLAEVFRVYASREGR